MIDTAKVISTNATTAAISSRNMFVAVSLMSFAALLLELASLACFRSCSSITSHFSNLDCAARSRCRSGVRMFAARMVVALVDGSTRSSAMRRQRHRHHRSAGSCRPQRGVAASHLAQLLAAHDYLSRLRRAVLPYRSVVLDRLCATRGARHTALWRRPARRFAGMSGAGAAAERHRRTQHHPLRRPGRLFSRGGLGCARPASSSCVSHRDSGGAHRRQLPQ